MLMWLHRLVSTTREPIINNIWILFFIVNMFTIFVVLVYWLYIPIYGFYYGEFYSHSSKMGSFSRTWEIRLLIKIGPSNHLRGEFMFVHYFWLANHHNQPKWWHLIVPHFMFKFFFFMDEKSPTLGLFFGCKWQRPECDTPMWFTLVVSRPPFVAITFCWEKSCIVFFPGFKTTLL